MRSVSVFNHVTLDGFFTDKNGDMSWAHGREDAEWTEFTAGNAKGEAMLLFGRITYEMMAGFWPTPEAKKSMPDVAKGMNEAPKVVFSKTLKEATWNNTKVMKDATAGVRKLKKESGPDMVIFGSGTIISQLAQDGLIDEYQMVVNPLVIGNGRTMFESVKKKLDLKLTDTRAFRNGNVLLTYKPAKK